jgi:hypothetical protein
MGSTHYGGFARYVPLGIPLRVLTRLLGGSLALAREIWRKKLIPRFPGVRKPWRGPGRLKRKAISRRLLAGLSDA